MIFTVIILDNVSLLGRMAHASVAHKELCHNADDTRVEGRAVNREPDVVHRRATPGEKAVRHQDHVPTADKMHLQSSYEQKRSSVAEADRLHEKTIAASQMSTQQVISRIRLYAFMCSLECLRIK